MNRSLLAIIKRIVAEQGENILNDPQRLKPYVSDYASAEPKEDRLAFGRAIQNGFYMELKRASPADRARVKASQVSRLQTITGFDTSRCSAAIDLLEAVIAPVAEPRSAPNAVPQSASSSASTEGFSKPKISKRTLLFAIAAALGALLGDLIAAGTNIIAKYSAIAEQPFVEDLTEMAMLHGLWVGLNGLGISVGIFLVLTIFLKKKLLITSIIKSAIIGILVGIVSGIISPYISSFIYQIFGLSIISRIVFWGVFGCGLGFGISFYIKNFPKTRAMLAGLVGGAAGGLVSGFMHITLAVTISGFIIGLFISWAEEALREAWITVVWGPKETRTIALGEKPISFGSTNEADVYLPKRAGDVNSPAIRAVISIKNGAVEFEDKTTGKRSVMRNDDEVTLDKIKIVVSTKKTRGIK